MNASTAWHQVKAYILNPAHVLNVFYVLLGGYAVAGFAWEFSHRGELAGYVLENRLPSGEYPSLPMLVVTAILAGSLWLVLSIFLARLTGRQLDAVLSRLSGVFLSATLLAFLPVLSLPGVERKQQPLLTLALIATMGAIAAMAVITIQQGFRSINRVRGARRNRFDRAGHRMADTTRYSAQQHAGNRAGFRLRQFTWPFSP